MKSTITLLCSMCCALSVFAQTPCLEVVGYYPGWQWYDRNNLVSPSTIDYSQYTIIQYAFMNVLADGHLQITDPWGDKNLLLGSINWATAPFGYDTAYDLGNSDYHIANTNLAHYCHQNDVQLLMSVGGWTQSFNFSSIAADATLRSTFASDCAYICALYELDGIDIDWEYPANAQDAANFTLLLEDVREALDAMEITMSQELMLTAAVSASSTSMEFIEWDNVVPLLDIINLMSYDFYGTWDAVLNHNAPLYTPAQGDATFSCDYALQNLMTVHAVPAGKITMGIPFYGRTQLSNTTPALFGTGNGQADNSHFGVDEGTPLYYNILLQQDDFTTYWDNVAKVPYALSSTNNSFLSYDDSASVALKAQYIVEHQLRGCIIWEITGDYVETSPGSGVIADTPLARSINDVFCATPERVTEAEESFVLYPNPAEQYIRLRFTSNVRHDEVVLCNYLGQTVRVIPISNGSDVVIPLEDLSEGCYHLRIGNHVHLFMKQN
ncbi:MAG: glycosyl hydrolase family 18 protein [Flavobacteriales bacterium]